MDNNKSEAAVFELDSEAIKSIIYEIRGQKDILDFDLVKSMAMKLKSLINK